MSFDKLLLCLNSQIFEMFLFKFTKKSNSITRLSLKAKDILENAADFGYLSRV